MNNKQYVLKILPLTDEVAEYYINHGHYHEGDAGLDLYVPKAHMVPGDSLGHKIPLGIKTEMVMKE